MSEHKNPYPGENNTGHFWDDDQDVRELNNRPPRWYMFAMYISVISVVVYALYFPAIPWFGDNTKGMANWSSIDELNESVAELEKYRQDRFADTEKAIANSSLEEIVLDDELRTYSIKTAKVLFGDNCAACHGAGGQGNDGFPVLADDDWLFGGTLSAISASIINGRQGNMPAMPMTADEANTLADHILAVGSGAAGSDAGKALYMTKGCIGCHSPTMAGNQALGAANLSDGIYRFKADDQKASVLRTITHGINQAHDPQSQNAVMPAFGTSSVIDAVQIKKLAVYVHQLGGGVKVKAVTKAPADPRYAPVVAKSDSFVDVIAAAEANYKKNLDQRMAWRDTGKMIKKAKKDKDVALAKKANTQAVNALRQASVAGTAGPTF